MHKIIFWIVQRKLDKGSVEESRNVFWKAGWQVDGWLHDRQKLGLVQAYDLRLQKEGKQKYSIALQEAAPLSWQLISIFILLLTCVSGRDFRLPRHFPEIVDF